MSVELKANGSLGMDIIDVWIISADEENATLDMGANVSLHNPTTFGVNGEMMLVIGQFTVKVPFQFENVHVDYP